MADCAVCSRVIESSYLYFAQCKHAVHYTCYVRYASTLSPEAMANEAVACEGCLLERVADTTSVSTRDEFLRTLKTRFTRATGELFDDVASRALSVEEIDHLSRGKATTLSKLQTLMLDGRLEFADLMARSPHAIVDVYRAGFRAVGDLARMRFMPAQHVRRATHSAVAVWHVCALYADVDLDTLTEGAFGLSLRDLVDHVYMKPAEWALLNVTVDRLIAKFGALFDAAMVGRFSFTASQWRRYMHMQKHHLLQLRLTTRKAFDAAFVKDRDGDDDEWYPAADST